MYNPITMTDNRKPSVNMESYSIDVSRISAPEDVVTIEDHSDLYQEAVFKEGNKTLKPIEEDRKSVV